MNGKAGSRKRNSELCLPKKEKELRRKIMGINKKTFVSRFFLGNATRANAKKIKSGIGVLIKKATR